MEPIAIIGVGCRFPGAADKEAFWQLLRTGVDAITEVPPERWPVDDYYDPDPAAPGKMTTRYAGFLDQVDQFDPHFFGISPREAASMDPQQRLLLEVAWEALEDSGQVLERLAGSATGVFIGISNNDYRLEVNDPKLIDPYVGTGNLFSIAAGRVSYLSNFVGPAIAIDTACSSSLVAVHLACQSLLSGESTLALAGGVNVILSPASTIALSKLSALSPDGRCRTFDARANGYVRGEGAGFVVLKPLTQAVADGDLIYAVIRGSAINHDGRSNGLTAPNGPSQAALIRRALERADVAPAQVDYVEAHGTGTPLGDPIEAEALGSVFSGGRPEGLGLFVGSVKTNIGHLEAAAGIASLIKVALSLQHGEIPPSLHFQEPNPYIAFEELRLRVPRSLAAWPDESGPAVAGISSFGFAGTNAHLVLEAAPEAGVSAGDSNQSTSDRAKLLALSARSPEALRSLARSYRDLMVVGGSASANSVYDVCYTAGTRRTHHDYRLALAFHNWQELVEHLESFLRGEPSRWIAVGRRQLNRHPKLALVFTGQGPQWWAMGRELLQEEPVFRERLEECDRLLRLESGENWSLLQELAAEESDSRLDQTEFAQPAIFGIQVALASLWRSWGIEPDAVVGHSMGEVAAAHVVGALSLPDAVKVIYHRGRLMQPATGMGKMAVVELSPAETEQALAAYSGRLSVAAINSANSTVISGEPSAVDELTASLEQQQVFVRELPVNYAFHSAQMDASLDELEQSLADLRPQPASVPLISTVSGQEQDGAELNARYWRKNVRQSVRFADAIGELLQRGHDQFLEVGPHPVLAGSISQCLQQHNQDGTVLPSLRRGEPERASLLASLGRLYAAGFPIDWRKLFSEGGRPVSLPSYPWQRERFWIQDAEVEQRVRPEPAPPRSLAPSQHPLLGGRLPPLAHLPGNHFWEVEFDRQLLAYLDDHRVLGSVAVPASVYLEMALAAATEAMPAKSHTVAQVTLEHALFLPDQGSRTVQLILSPDESGRTAFQVLSRQPEVEGQPEAWKLHAQGKIDHGMAEVDRAEQLEATLEEIRQRCAGEIPVPAYYQGLAESGLEYGPNFQGIAGLWRRDGEALGEIGLPEALQQERSAYRIHPALLDTCFQVLGAALPMNGGYAANGGVYVPTSLGSVQIFRRPPERLWSHAQLRSTENGAFAGDIRLLDGGGQVVAEALDLRIQRWGRELQEAVPSRRSASGESAPEASADPTRQESPTTQEAASGDGPQLPTRQTLLTLEPSERQQLLEAYLAQQVAKSMKLAASKLDVHKPLEDQGFDSLMAIEVKYRVESELAVNVPVRNLVERPTVAQLAAELQGLLLEEALP